MQDAETKSTAFHFNSVMEDMYADAIQYLLDEIDGRSNDGMRSDRAKNAIFDGWPLKFPPVDSVVCASDKSLPRVRA